MFSPSSIHRTDFLPSPPTVTDRVTPPDQQISLKDYLPQYLRIHYFGFANGPRRVKFCRQLEHYSGGIVAVGGHANPLTTLVYKGLDSVTPLSNGNRLKQPLSAIEKFDTLSVRFAKCIFSNGPVLLPIRRPAALWGVEGWAWPAVGTEQGPFLMTESWGDATIFT